MERACNAWPRTVRSVAALPAGGSGADSLVVPAEYLEIVVTRA